MCTSLRLLHPCNKVGAHLPFRKTQITQIRLQEFLLSHRNQRVSSFSPVNGEIISLSTAFTLQPVILTAPLSTFPALCSLAAVICYLFCTQTGRRRREGSEQATSGSSGWWWQLYEPWLEHNHQLWSTAHKTRPNQTCLVSDQTASRSNGWTLKSVCDFCLWSTNTPSCTSDGWFKFIIMPKTQWNEWIYFCN